MRFDRPAELSKSVAGTKQASQNMPDVHGTVTTAEHRAAEEETGGQGGVFRTIRCHALATKNKKKATPKHYISCRTVNNALLSPLEEEYPRIPPG